MRVFLRNSVLHMKSAFYVTVEKHFCYEKTRCVMTWRSMWSSCQSAIDNYWQLYQSKIRFVNIVLYFFNAPVGRKRSTIFVMGLVFSKGSLLKKIPAGDLWNIRAMESIDRVPKHLRHYQKWIPHEKIRPSCGVVVLLTRNRRRARPFWK